MQITLINGNDPSKNPGFEEYINQFEGALTEDHKVKMFNLYALSINDCIGCFGCWQKTPGKCIIKDDMSTILPGYMHSDLVLFASPLILGFPNARLKTSHDRSIPVIHPYVEISEAKLNHKPRYHKYPKMGLLIEKEEDTDTDDLNILNNIYQSLAFNFHSEFVYLKAINNIAPEVIANEISHC